MPYTISEKVQKWALESQTTSEFVDFNTIHEKIEFLARTLFSEYLPCAGSKPDFWIRLKNWLDKAKNEKDQKTLFQLVLHIFFIGNKEFSALYRAALRVPVYKWIIDELDLKFDDNNFESKMSQALRQTWFCPISDSLRISDFYHVNNITGIDLRPDWRSIAEMGKNIKTEHQKIIEYMARHRLRRLVLLEDFVGSGNQMNSAIRFAASMPNIDQRSNSKGLPVLVVPLIICPDGVKEGKKIENNFPNLKFDPVLQLSQEVFVAKVAQEGEPNIFPSIRDVCIRLYSIIQGKGKSIDKEALYGPFGYEDTGGLVVMYTNTPDNTLPLIHHQSETWSPLFPRSFRV